MENVENMKMFVMKSKVWKCVDAFVSNASRWGDVIETIASTKTIASTCAVMLCLAALTCSGEVVSSAAGGWFAVDARAVKDTTWEGGVIVAGETNLVLQCSANAWGAAVGGDGATVAYSNDTTGATGTIAEKTTAEAVDWTPAVGGLYTLTHTVATSGEPMVLTATFSVPLVYPAYVASLSDAMKTKFDTWATTFGSRDPDGVYTNAFLLNVATNDEASAIAAFKITYIAVTNENDGAAVEVGKPEPLPPSTFFNGELWYQVATNLAADAVWTDLVEGSYTWDTNTFFRAKLDLTHPDAPTVPTTSEAGRSTKFRPVE